MRFRKYFLLSLVVTVLGACLLALPMEAEAAEIASGTCGDNLTWVLTDDGVLTISGMGAMLDYDTTSNTAPWFFMRTEITEVIIEGGVTSIGKHAFYSSRKLKKITIPGSVISFGRYAFDACDELEIINILEIVLLSLFVQVE